MVEWMERTGGEGGGRADHGGGEEPRHGSWPRTAFASACLHTCEGGPQGLRHDADDLLGHILRRLVVNDLVEDLCMQGWKVWGSH